MPRVTKVLITLAVIGLITVVAEGAIDLSPSSSAEIAEAEELIDLGDSRCAATAAAVVLRTFGKRADILQIDSKMGQKGSDTTLFDIQNALTTGGLFCRALKWSRVEQMPVSRAAPAIVQIRNAKNRGHFVTLLERRPKSALVVDFWMGSTWISLDELQRSFGWDGTALHVSVHGVGLPSTKSIWLDLLTPSRLVMAVLGLGLVLVAVLWGRVRLHVPIMPHKTAEQSPQQGTPRSGVSLVEVLVVLAIISLLAALVAPGIQSARLSAQKLSCANNLKQLGIAVQNRLAANRPVSSGTIPGEENYGLTPIVQLLAELDQSALGERVQPEDLTQADVTDPPTVTTNTPLLHVVLPVTQCPSDSIGPRTNYRISNGLSPFVVQGSGGNLSNLPVRSLRGYLFAKKGACPDGTSNTVAISEKLTGDRNPNKFTAWRDSIAVYRGRAPIAPEEMSATCRLPQASNPNHLSFGGSTWLTGFFSTSVYNHILTPNSFIPDCVNGDSFSEHQCATTRSLHTGGVNSLMADGSVRFFANPIDEQVWWALGTVDGAESVSQ